MSNKSLDIKITANEILMALGYKDTSASEFVLEQAEQSAEKASILSHPKKTYKKLKIDRVEGNAVFTESGLCFSSESLAKEADGCSHILVAIYTLGNEIDEAIKNALTLNDTLSAMMLDAAGSSLVSCYAKSMWSKFVSELEDGEGMTRGFAPGEEDFTLEQQKEVFAAVNAESIDVTLNGDMMMRPAKTISVVYGIGYDINTDNEPYSCLSCPRKDCIMRDDRQVEVKVHLNERTKTIKAPVGTELREAFLNNDIHFDFPCSGKGTCGGCTARFVKTVPKTTQQDEQSLSQSELDGGWRLVCMVEIEHPMELYIQLSHIEVLHEHGKSELKADHNAIAVDIGTTTVVCHLIDNDNGNIIDTVAMANRQRKYGADVASRILYEMTKEQGRQELTVSIVGQINEMITLLKDSNDIENLKAVYVAGNTIMTHILLGYHVSGMGQAPYEPVSLARAKVKAKSLGMNLDCDVYVFEGIDSYVGSDIALGAAYCGLMDSDGYTMLIDIGTNGEIALGNKNTLYCCATAAGPAFEAVNIHDGMSAIPGAVSEFIYENGSYSYKTIGGVEPRGVCGSGVLDIVSALLKSGVVDGTGRMIRKTEHVEFNEKLKEYFVVAKKEGREVIFTSKDVREVQLAKAAIAAGIRTLVETANISYGDIQKVFIAGGFGNYMRIDSALGIGLIPKELKGKIVTAGNTSAKGAISCHNPLFRKKIESYVKKAKYIDLSTSAVFQNYYIESMGFDE